MPCLDLGSHTAQLPVHEEPGLDSEYPFGLVVVALPIGLYYVAILIAVLVSVGTKHPQRRKAALTALRILRWRSGGDAEKQ